MSASKETISEEEKPPTSSQLLQLRQSLISVVKEKGKELFQEADLIRFQDDDSYVERFWIHGFFIPGSDRIHNTTGLVTEALLWRKEFMVLSIKEQDLDQSLIDGGSLYFRGRDTQGGRLLIFSVKRYIKDPKLTPKRKQFFAYLLERLERETGGGKITIIFDCHGAGIKNIEIEAIHFIIQALIHYYPNLVRRILVQEMPWVMNTVWKLVKSLLPGPAQERIKFVNKATISEFVDMDSLPRELGGFDDWEYTWIPEPHQASVTEEEENSFKITPKDIIMFCDKDDSNGALESSFTLHNRSSQTLAYKVRSTRPDLFLVSPHNGILIPNQQSEIRIQAISRSQLSGQRFQIAVVRGVKDGDDFKKMLGEKNKEQEIHILTCELEQLRKTSMEVPSVEQSNRQAKAMSMKLGEMEDRMGQLRILLVVQCFILIFGMAYFWMSRTNLTNRRGDL